MPKTKICTSCKQRRPLEKFSKQTLGRYGVRPKCKACESEDAKARYALKVGNPIPIQKPKQHLRSWQPRPKQRFEAYLKNVKCVLSPFTCVTNEVNRIVAKTDEGLWQLDKSVFYFLAI